MTATCPEGEAWAASRNWNHGTHFLWDPRAAPTFHPLSTPRHRAQCRTCQPPRSTLVLYSGKSRVLATWSVPRPLLWRQWWRYAPGVMTVCGCSSGSSLCAQKSVSKWRQCAFLRSVGYSTVFIREPFLGAISFLDVHALVLVVLSVSSRVPCWCRDRLA